MARGNATAQAASKNALGYSQNLQGQQQSLYGTLAPALTGDITNPQGFTPEEKSAQRTAAQESAGGGMAGAVGQSALNTQRTKNAGGSDVAIGEAARGAGRNLSRAALSTELEDAALKQQKQAEAKRGMEALYGISTGGGNQALGQVASNVNANTNAENASWNWAKYLLDPALAGAGQGAGLAAACWIAERIYGFDDMRTFLLRAWLNGPFRQTMHGRIIMSLYRLCGQWIAARPRLALKFKPLFEIALRHARVWDSEIALDL